MGIKNGIMVQALLICALLCNSVSFTYAGNIADTVALPDIEGYKTLKCDFHMHTVFSDGSVWPSFRVHEALRDGLDAISITEHMDFEGYPDDIKKNYNRSHEIAKEADKDKKLIIINGVEVSPRVPPYHNNLLFVKDAKAIPAAYMSNTKKRFKMKDEITRDQLMAPFLEAKKQDAFVVYNHPSYIFWDTKDTVIFSDIHLELYNRGILKGAEVANGGKYFKDGHRIAMKYNLTMFSNSDEHNDIYPKYKGTHRPMTLVFVKERSEEGIREALENRRTAAYFDDYLIARQQEAEAFFKASIEVDTKRSEWYHEKRLTVNIYNKTDIPYRIKIHSEYDAEWLPLGYITLKAHDTTTFVLKKMWVYPPKVEIEAEVQNILVTPEEALRTKLFLLTDKE